MRVIILNAASMMAMGLLFTAGCGSDPDSDAVLFTSDATRDILPRFHCVAKWGIDWNEVLGVTDAAIVSPFCVEIHATDPYIPEVKWITNTANGLPDHPVVYPEGYEPSSKVPMNDFLLKLARVRYVVQPGGQEFVFSARNIEKLVTVGDLYRGSDIFTPDEFVWPAASLLGRLPSLSPGAYSAEIHFDMLDTHCDGQSTDFSESCLPPGDTFVLARSFRVVP